VKNEPGVTSASFAHGKKEHDAPAPPSTKKACRLGEDTACQLEYQAPDNPEEFLGLRAAECASFNKVQPGTLEFVLAWSRQDTKKTEIDRARRLGLCVNLEEDDEDNDEDDAGLSQWRGGDGGQGCSTWASKDERPSCHFYVARNIKNSTFEFCTLII
jgi:hypothetical protein